MSDQDVASGKADVEPAKRSVAKHALINAQGAEVENEEEATGIRYTILANSKTFDYQTGSPAGAPVTMLAIFGAKTLATNETSQVRHSPKGDGSPDAQYEAVTDRFALIATGKWIDRTRDGVGVVIDLDAMAKAIVTAFGNAGQAMVESEVRAKLADKSYLTTAKGVPQVRDEYNRIVGRQVKTLDDLMAGLKTA